MSDPKQIKFSFTVDEAAAQKARALIRDITSDLQKLAEAANKAGSGLGGGFGGGSGIGMRVGGGGASSPESARVISKVAPAGRGLVQGFMDQKQIFKGISDGSKESLRSMTDHVKTAMSQQGQAVMGLDRAMEKLLTRYSNFSKSQGIFGGARQAAAGGMRPPPLPLGLRGFKSSVQYSQDGEDAEGDIIRAAHSAEARANIAAIPDLESGPSKTGGLWNFLTKARTVPGTGPGAGGVMGGIGTAMRGVGMNPSMLARGGLAAAGIGGLAAIKNELMNDSNRFSDYSAMRGQMFAPEIRASHQGDFRNTMALSSIYKDSNMRKDYQDQDTGFKRFMHGAGGVLSGIWNRDANEIGMGFSGNTAANAIIKSRQKMVENQRASDPLQEDILGGIASGWQGRVGGMRALGIGDRTDPTKLRPGERLGAHYRRMDQALTKSGYSVGEGAGALGQLEAGGTRRAGYDLMFGTLNAQAGGLKGASGYAGTMSRFGGGRNFLSAAQVMGGQQTDVAVADTLAQFSAQQAGAFNMAGGAGTGLGIMGMLGTGVGKGVDSRMIAEQNMKGFGGLQKIMGGGTDAYQSARNLQIAIGAAPGAGVYGQDYLANKMDLGNMADIMSGSTGVSSIAKSLGVTKGMVEQQYKGVTASTMERIISDPNMANTGMAKTMGSMQQSGQDPRAWFKSQSKTKGFKKDEALSDYAAFLLMSGQATDEASAMGLARTMTGMGTKAATKGKKVGDVAGGSLEKAQAEETAEQMDKEIELITTKAGELKASISIQAEATAKLASLSQQQAATQEQVIEAMEEYSLAIRLMGADPNLKQKDAFSRAKEQIGQQRAEAHRKNQPSKQDLRDIKFMGPK